MERKKVRHKVHLIDDSRPEHHEAARPETRTKGEVDGIRCKNCGHPLVMRNGKYHHSMETIWNSLKLPFGSCAFWVLRNKESNTYDWCCCENPESDSKESD